MLLTLMSKSRIVSKIMHKNNALNQLIILESKKQSCSQILILAIISKFYSMSFKLRINCFIKLTFLA